MTETSASPVAGIDLGTTFSLVAWVDATGRPATIMNAEGDLTTPSVVFFDKTGVVTGKEAVRAAEFEPERVAQFAKRDMGRVSFHKSIRGEPLPPEVIQALVLKKLKADAELKLGTLSRAVITVPAYFDEPRRKATEDAGRLAGLDVLDILNEPTAAAISYGVQQGFVQLDGKQTERETVLVYDLGGGTFDVTLMEIEGHSFKALGTAGDVYLGGVDWTERIVDLVGEQFMTEHNVDPRIDDCALQNLMQQAEDAKRALTAREETTLMFAHDGQRFRTTITRAQFEEMTGELLDRTILTVRKVLREAKKEWKDITRLLLVGGSSRMPAVQSSLEKESGLKVDRSLSPDEAVAHGAAVYAALLAGNQTSGVRDISVSNVNSHDLGVLGVETATGRNRRRVMIPRNTQLPCKSRSRFKTFRDNQSSVVVNIVEGGDASGKGATSIGRCQVSPLPPDLPKGTPVEVTFRYRANGRIDVSAELPTINKQAALQIERASGLNDESIQSWLTRIEEGLTDAAIAQATGANEPKPSETPGPSAKPTVSEDKPAQNAAAEGVPPQSTGTSNDTSQSEPPTTPKSEATSSVEDRQPAEIVARASLSSVEESSKKERARQATEGDPKAKTTSASSSRNDPAKKKQKPDPRADKAEPAVAAATDAAPAPASDTGGPESAATASTSQVTADATVGSTTPPEPAANAEQTTENSALSAAELSTAGTEIPVESLIESIHDAVPPLPVIVTDESQNATTSEESVSQTAIVDAPVIEGAPTVTEPPAAAISSELAAQPEGTPATPPVESPGTQPPSVDPPQSGDPEPGLLTADEPEPEDAEPEETGPEIEVSEQDPVWLEEELRQARMQTMKVMAVNIGLHALLLLIFAFIMIPVTGGSEIFSIVTSMSEEPSEEVVEEVVLEQPEDIREDTKTEVVTDVLTDTKDEFSIDVNDLAPSALEVETTDAAGDAPVAPLKGEMSGRSQAGRKALLTKYGGTAESEAAVAAGLAWLSRHQLPDGSWAFDHTNGECDGTCGQPGSLKKTHVAATGLALLAYMGAGSTYIDGEYQKTIERGLGYLMSQVKETETGLDLRGDFEGNSGMYTHGVATICFCEAFALNEQAIRNTKSSSKTIGVLPRRQVVSQTKQLRAVAEGAVRFIVSAQNAGGGWRYNSTSSDSDTSVVGWQVMGLASAHASRIPIPSSVHAGVTRFLNSVQVDSGAQYGYAGPAAKDSTTAIGLLCRMYMGWDRKQPALQRGVAYLSKRGPILNNMYYNYYATQVMHHWGGEEWTKWNNVLREHLVKTQIRKGHGAGSWNIADPHGGGGGRLYMTCLATMTLEVYYRHLPLYDEIAGKGIAGK